MQYNINGRDATVAALGVAAAVSGAYLAMKWQEQRYEQPPSNDKWRRVGTLNELACYPIKSCGMVKATSMHCSQLGLSSGLLRDRTFVIINSDENFESARTHPRMVLIQPRIDGEYLVLSAPGMDDLRVHIAPHQITENATVWGQKVPSADCGDEAADWICKYLEKPDGGYRLMRYPDETSPRTLDKKSETYPDLKQKDLGVYCDLASFCLINEASVKDLNDRLSVQGARPAEPMVFRGNFVISSEEPYAEDNWNWVKIGDAVFRGVAPCTRCIMTTLNYENGTRNPNREPLATLKKYRSVHAPSPTMGRYLGIRKEADISVGDPVYVA